MKWLTNWLQSHKFEFAGLILGDDGQIAVRKIATLIALLVWSAFQIARAIAGIMSLGDLVITTKQFTMFNNFAQGAVQDCVYMFSASAGWNVLHRATTKDVTTPYPPSPGTNVATPKETAS